MDVTGHRVSQVSCNAPAARAPAAHSGPHRQVLSPSSLPSAANSHPHHPAVLPCSVLAPRLMTTSPSCVPGCLKGRPAWILLHTTLQLLPPHGSRSPPRLLLPPCLSSCCAPAGHALANLLFLSQVEDPTFCMKPSSVASAHNELSFFPDLLS